ncbi:MAG: DUF2500 domain-containing protein [Cellulosilyticaceae bacterium]
MMGWNFFIIPFIVQIMFVVIFAIIVVRVIRGIRGWHANNNSPVLTVEAAIVAKRGHTSRGTHHHGEMHHHSTSTSYYVTFEVESGDRMEVHVPSQEYGLLVEGDRGRLTFQGTRYMKFERER